MERVRTLTQPAREAVRLSGPSDSVCLPASAKFPSKRRNKVSDVKMRQWEALDINAGNNHQQMSM